MTIAPAPAALAFRVDEVLSTFLRQQEPSPLLDAVRRFVSTGGKRMRPAFCYWGWHGVAEAGADDNPAILAGAALELFHCFALIHDDIIDASTMRRGKPSLHEEFAGWHEDQGWQGDSQAFGRNAALLAGNLCATWAVALFDQCHGPPAAKALFTVTRAEAIAGEFLDITAQARGSGPGAVERALQVARLKTARYSIARPLQIGAALAEADEALLSSLEDFGDLLGEAFQLRDDILGVFGDPARTGKSVLDDLRQAKPTVLLALAWRRSNRRHAKLLREIVGQPDLDEQGAGAVRDVMVSTGALEETEARIERSHRQALKVLNSLYIGETARENLRELANFAVSRRS